VFLSWQRQVRSQLTVWFALILLFFTAAWVGLMTAQDRWTRHRTADVLQQMNHGLPVPTTGLALPGAVMDVYQAVVKQSGVVVFSQWVVFAVFVNVLLPIWSLSFATDAVGGDRESRSLIWLLTRPMWRPGIYLAKFVALLPWALGLNLGGFAILCLAAGHAGYPALRLYWPAVLCGSLAFCALFMLFGALVRHAAVAALVYSFFLEMIVGNMPGNMKRVSIGFYTRCMMYERAKEFGFEAQKASVYNQVNGTTAWIILMAMTVALLLAGMVVFSRAEYQDLS
jgi:ABC-type transport system involved in multi-copper enzyme maturation permease subunit